MVRRDFAEERASEHERMIAALLEACAFCDQTKNRPLLAEMLAQPHYVNAPADCLKRGLRTSAGASVEDSTFETFNVFHRDNANDPTDEKAEWLVGRLYELMEHSILQPPPTGRTPIVKNIFRRDIYQRARAAVLGQSRALQAEAASYHPERFGT
jgi:hypothetical protein